MTASQDTNKVIDYILGTAEIKVAVDERGQSQKQSRESLIDNLGILLSVVDVIREPTVLEQEQEKEAHSPAAPETPQDARRRKAQKSKLRKQERMHMERSLMRTAALANTHVAQALNRFQEAARRAQLAVCTLCTPPCERFMEVKIGPPQNWGYVQVVMQAIKSLDLDPPLHRTTAISFGCVLRLAAEFDSSGQLWKIILQHAEREERGGNRKLLRKWLNHIRDDDVADALCQAITASSLSYSHWLDAGIIAELAQIARQHGPNSCRLLCTIVKWISRDDSEQSVDLGPPRFTTPISEMAVGMTMEEMQRKLRIAWISVSPDGARDMPKMAAAPRRQVPSPENRDRANTPFPDGPPCLTESSEVAVVRERRNTPSNASSDVLMEDPDLNEAPDSAKADLRLSQDLRTSHEEEGDSVLSTADSTCSLLEEVGFPSLLRDELRAPGHDIERWMYGDDVAVVATKLLIWHGSLVEKPIPRSLASLINAMITEGCFHALRDAITSQEGRTKQRIRALQLATAALQAHCPEIERTLLQESTLGSVLRAPLGHREACLLHEAAFGFLSAAVRGGEEYREVMLGNDATLQRALDDAPEWFANCVKFRLAPVINEILEKEPEAKGVSLFLVAWCTKYSSDAEIDSKHVALLRPKLFHQTKDEHQSSAAEVRAAGPETTFPPAPVSSTVLSSVSEGVSGLGSWLLGRVSPQSPRQSKRSARASSAARRPKPVKRGAAASGERERSNSREETPMRGRRKSSPPPDEGRPVTPHVSVRDGDVAKQMDNMHARYQASALKEPFRRMAGVPDENSSQDKEDDSKHSTPSAEENDSLAGDPRDQDCADDTPPIYIDHVDIAQGRGGTSQAISHAIRDEASKPSTYVEEEVVAAGARPLSSSDKSSEAPKRDNAYTRSDAYCRLVHQVHSDTAPTTALPDAAARSSSPDVKPVSVAPAAASDREILNRRLHELRLGIAHTQDTISSLRNEVTSDGATAEESPCSSSQSKSPSSDMPHSRSPTPDLPVKDQQPSPGQKLASAPEKKKRIDALEAALRESTVKMAELRSVMGSPGSSPCS